MRLLLPFLLVGCHPDPEPTDDPLLATVEAEMQGYTGWPQTAEWTGEQPSLDGTHGETVQIWWNGAAWDAFDAGGGAAMPEGAMAVKEGYDHEGELRHIVAHYRVEGELYFAEFDEDLEPRSWGTPEGCVSCHAHGQDGILAQEW